MKMSNPYMLVGLVVAPAVLLNMSATEAVKQDPVFTTPKKAMWMAVIWIVPYLGVVLAQKALKAGTSLERD